MQHPSNGFQTQEQFELHHLRMNVLRRTAWLLGPLGLVPFVALSVALWLVDGRMQPMLAQALLLYSVCIISFLGGIHWGIALVFHEMPAVYVVTALVWSVLPALAAWPLALLPIGQALAWAAVLLLVVLAVDLRLNRHYPLPLWFASLRSTLTAVACTSLLLAWMQVAGR